MQKAATLGFQLGERPADICLQKLREAGGLVSIAGPPPTAPPRPETGWRGQERTVRKVWQEYNIWRPRDLAYSQVPGHHANW